VFQTLSRNDFAAKVNLLEYDDKDGFVLLHDAGKDPLEWGKLGVGFVRRADPETRNSIPIIR
jgi:hypothetical protein